MAVAVLSVAEGENYPHFLRRVASRDCGFIPSRVERLYVVILQYNLQNLVDVQGVFVRVADLENTHRSSMRLAFFVRKRFFLFVQLLLECKLCF